MADHPAPNAPTAYDLLLALEELESFAEEMDELGATTVADLARLDRPEAAALRAELTERGLTSLADLRARMDELHRRLDALEAPGRPADQ